MSIMKPIKSIIGSVKKKSCYRCKNRTGLFCPHWTNMEHMIDEERLRTFTTMTSDGKKHFVGCNCSNFTPMIIPIVVVFNGKTIFDGEIS